MYVLMRRVSQRGGRCQWVRYALCSSAGTLERVIRGQPDPTNCVPGDDSDRLPCLERHGVGHAPRRGGIG